MGPMAKRSAAGSGPPAPPPGPFSGGSGQGAAPPGSAAELGSVPPGLAPPAPWPPANPPPGPAPGYPPAWPAPYGHLAAPGPTGYAQPGHPLPGDVPPSPPGPPQPGYAPSAGYAPPGSPPPGYAVPGYPPPGAPALPPPGNPWPGPPPGFPTWAWAPPVIGWGRFRAQSIGELLDSAFTVYRRRFLAIVAVMALFQVPYIALQYFVADPAESPLLGALGIFGGSGSRVLTPEQVQSAAGQLWIVALVLLAYLLIFLPMAQAAVVRIVSDDVLDRSAGIGTALGLAGRRALGLVGYVLLEIAAALIPAAVPVAVAVGVGGLAGAGLSALLLLPYAVYLAVLLVRLSLGVQALILERLSPIAAFRRSLRLTSGSFWRIVLFYLVITLVSGVISAILEGLASLVMGLAPVGTQLAIQTLASGLIGIFTSPLILILLTLVYYDIRIRREAFDLEMLAQSL
jgi:hypothetical protein